MIATQVRVEIDPHALKAFQDMGKSLKRLATSPETTILSDLKQEVSDWLDKGVEYCRKILIEETKIMDRDFYRPTKSKLMEAIKKTGPRIVKGKIVGGIINIKKIEQCVSKSGFNYAYLLEGGYGPYKMSPLQKKWAAFWAKAKGFPPGKTSGTHPGVKPVRYIFRTAQYMKHYYIYEKKIEKTILRLLGKRFQYKHPSGSHY